MFNDSEEKIIIEWNTVYSNMATKSFNDVYRELKKFAEKNGKQSRITDYEKMDNLNKENKSIVELQQKNRRTGGRKLLELWMRAKKVKKMRKKIV